MNKIYQYNCPKCGKERFYTEWNNWNATKKKQRLCGSCVRKGRIPWNKGISPSKETIEKMSLSAKNRPLRSNEIREKISLSQTGHKSYFPIGYKHSEITKCSMSQSQLKRYINKEAKEITSQATKNAMHRPDIREKHIKSLAETKYLGRKTDKGQLEMINCWNKMGFNFELNYQIKTDADLFYIDGYDKERNVVLEYDSKYHQKHLQQQKDLIRQQRVIDILNPKKFWRYDAVNKKCKNILERNE